MTGGSEMKSIPTVVVVSLLAVGGVVGCPTFVDTEMCANGACGDGDGGAESSVPDGAETSTDARTDRDPPPPGCETPNEPLKNPEKCLVDAFGVFVSPTGDDGNEGTKGKPYKTIGKALQGGRSRVVVCEGEYAEVLEIGRDVEIYGGVACTFDKGGKHPVIGPDAPIGLRIVGAGVKMFELDVRARAATAEGGSSVGVFAKRGSLEITRCVVEAGDGKDGAEAPAAGNNHFVDPAGNGASGNTGGPLKTCKCPMYGESVGGGGGNGGNVGNPLGQSGSGGMATPAAPTQGGFTGSGGAGAPSAAMACTPGTIGSPGTARTSGAGAARAGVVTEAGWEPASGSPGEAGNPGQGGGGGGGAYYLGVNGAGGGGGGCGGCGGAPGKGGAGGGASIGILALDANVSVVSSQIKTAKGGAGKSGGTGQAGGGGGGGTVGACSGAFGGAGAGGGGGGGGAGGLVAGIAYTGAPPKVDGKDLADTDAVAGVVVGAAGQPGTGGQGGDKATVPVDGAPGGVGGQGVAGVSKAVAKVDK